MESVSRVARSLSFTISEHAFRFQQSSRPLILIRCASYNLGDPVVERIRNPRPKPPTTPALAFGKYFTDHMYLAEFIDGAWARPRILPMQNFSLHPAAKVLHYAQESFEGMKAFRGEDGRIRCFRWEENMKRMLSSADRISFPTFNEKELLEGIKKLAAVDADWIPESPPLPAGGLVSLDGPLNFYSLYVRPTMIAVDPTLGVAPATHVYLYAVLSPVGPYFPGGMKPVSLYADPHYVRAWPGGTGGYKVGSNYAPTMYVQQVAQRHKCQAVLWLYERDGEHWLTEVGMMNCFVLWRNEHNEMELATPPLNGLILPGVTRRSVIELAREWNEFRVVEREISMKQLVKASHEKRLIEVFGTGTAAVVLPVGGIVYQSQELKIPSNNNSMTLRILRTITDIQYGRLPHQWALQLQVDELLDDLYASSRKRAAEQM